MNRAFKELDRNSNHSKPPTRANETKNDAENYNNEQDMGVKEPPFIDKFNEDSSPENGSEDSKSPSFKDYNKKLNIIWGNICVNPDSFRQQLWNEAGPAYDSIILVYKMVEEEENNPTDQIAKYSLSHEPIMFLSNNTGYTKECFLKEIFQGLK